MSIGNPPAVVGRGIFTRKTSGEKQCEKNYNKYLTIVYGTQYNKGEVIAMSDENNDLLKTMLQELRRGTITLSLLSRLRTPQYGYSLVESLEGKGFPVEPGTLYPLLRRLEKQGLLTSEWETGGSKPRKYYVLSDSGKTVFQQLRGEWDAITSNLNALLDEHASE